MVKQKLKHKKKPHYVRLSLEYCNLNYSFATNLVNFDFKFDALLS